MNWELAWGLCGLLAGLVAGAVCTLLLRRRCKQMVADATADFETAKGCMAQENQRSVEVLTKEWQGRLAKGEEDIEALKATIKELEESHAADSRESDRRKWVEIERLNAEWQKRSDRSNGEWEERLKTEKDRANSLREQLASESERLRAAIDKQTDEYMSKLATVEETARKRIETAENQTRNAREDVEQLRRQHSLETTTLRKDHLVSMEKLQAEKRDGEQKSFRQGERKWADNFKVKVFPYLAEKCDRGVFWDAFEFKVGRMYQLFIHGVPCLQPHMEITRTVSVSAFDRELRDQLLKEAGEIARSLVDFALQKASGLPFIEYEDHPRIETT